MPSYCEEQYIHPLEKKIKEQETIIDWLVSQLQARCNRRSICSACIQDIEKYGYLTCHNWNWKEAAQDAIKKR